MIYFFIPVFNEEGNIPSLLADVDSACKNLDETYRIIIVNDGSTDGTALLIKERMDRFPIEMLENIPNQGVGVSFDKGFRRFIELASEEDILVSMEGDNTSDLTTLPLLLDSIRSGKDFVLASVYSEGGEVLGTTKLRLLLSYTANFLSRTIFKMERVKTFSSFYRAYRFAALKKLYARYDNRVITEKGYISVVEVLIKLNQLGFTFEEIPTVLQSQKRAGVSKMKKWKTMLTYFRLFLKHLFASQKPPSS